MRETPKSFGRLCSLKSFGKVKSKHSDKERKERREKKT